MWIETIEIEGFGKLHDLSIRLSRGLNLIVGPNESGKSTLQEFVWAILYGADADDQVSRYLPWDSEGFGGKLIYHLEKGVAKGEVALARDFANQTILMTGGGARGNGLSPEKGADQFPGLAHLGIDRNVFLSTCLVRQGESFSIRGSWDVSSRLLNLIESGTQEGSVDLAIQRIRDLSEREIGSEETGPLHSILERLDILIREREEAVYRRQECQDDVLARRKAMASLQRSERKLAHVEASRSRRDVVTMERQLAEIRSLQRKSEEARKIADQGRDLPIIDRDGLRDAAGRRKAAQESLERVEAEVSDLDVKMLQIRASTEGKEMFANLPDDAQEIMVGFRDYLRSGRQRIQDEEQAFRERKRELQVAREDLEALAGKYEPFRENIDQVLEDLVESQKRKRDLETLKGVLSQRQAQETEAQLKLRTLRKRMILGYVGGALLGVGAIIAMINDLPTLAVTILVLLVGKGVILFGFFPQRVRRLDGELARFARRIGQNKDEIEILGGVMQLKEEVYRRAGVSSLQEFRKGFEKFGALEGRMPDLEQALRRESARLRKTRAEINPREDEAIELLQKTGSLDEGAPVTEAAIDEFAKEMGKVADSGREKEVLTGLFSLKASELETLEGQVVELKREEDQILEDAGVGSSDEFEELCALEDQVRDAERELAWIKDRLDTTLGEETFLELQERLESLRATIPADSDWEEEEEEEDETKEEERDQLISASTGDSSASKAAVGLRQEVREIRRRIAILDSRIESTSKEGRHLADIESDIEEVGRNIVFLKGERAVLDETEETLREMREDFLMKQFAPELAKVSSPFLRDITSGRYRKLFIDGDMNLKVSGGKGDPPMDVGSLGLGTQDQVYFVLRQAIGGILSRSGESLPLILDETFVGFDEERRKNAIRSIVKLSKKSQVIVLTCHGHQAKEIADACKKAGIRLRRESVAEFELSAAR
ncbi:MAG: AAA family ATPase [Planctomycetota bacterium]|nr:AAA family ATPase [Planctomycetota bacterium]